LDKRQFLIAGAAVVVLAGAGGVWMYQNRTITVPKRGGDLMTPSPLGEQALGQASAPVTIIEYASMTCPHCAHFHETTYPELKKRYIDTGKVRFIFREFPLDSVAATAFMVARCADKDKFFPLIEAMLMMLPPPRATRKRFVRPRLSGASAENRPSPFRRPTSRSSSSNR